jgi:hypothetical protein
MDPYLTKGYYAVRHHMPTAKTPGPWCAPGDRAASLQCTIPDSCAAHSANEYAHDARVAAVLGTVLLSRQRRPSLLRDAGLDWSTPAHDVLTAWLTSAPTLRMLAVETYLPSLRNVVELGGGRTGLIVSWNDGDSGNLQLVEYRDGMSLQQMPHLHKISAGE